MFRNFTSPSFSGPSSPRSAGPSSDAAADGLHETRAAVAEATAPAASRSQALRPRALELAPGVAHIFAGRMALRRAGCAGLSRTGVTPTNAPTTAAIARRAGLAHSNGVYRTCPERIRLRCFCVLRRP